MDLFKPLYKKHRHSIDGCFNTREPVDTVEGYKIEQKPIDCSFLRPGYAAYNLSPPDKVMEYTIPELPGTRILSGVLTQEMQCELVKEATSTYLADPRHLTNVDLHADIPRPIRLFHSSTSKKFREKQLRWVTLGGQYDWTDKFYPSFEVGIDDKCPSFPEPLAGFIFNSFGVRAEAAIVNYYSEGNTLSPHQDVAEQCSADLVSISLGCSCIFYVGIRRWDSTPLPILLNSGDIVIMGGPSRYAWHGVGRVVANSTPHELVRNEWADWIKGKRININIRQMLP